MVNSQKVRILIVEDEPSIGQICKRVLNNEGFEVDIVVNGVEAQKKLAENHYDLCLIDIMTPIMDGKQLFRWIEKNHPGLTAGVVFTTGDSINPDTKSFLERTGRPLLPKPFNLDELKTVIREVLDKVRK